MGEIGSRFLKIGMYSLRTYLEGVRRVLFRATVGAVVSPRQTLRFFEGMRDIQARAGEDRVLPTRSILQVLPPSNGLPCDVVLRGRLFDPLPGGTFHLLELSNLCYLVQASGARNIFEIGTHIGATTRLLAAHGGEEALVYTLDLPRDRVAHDVGREFRGTPEENLISQLEGDSLRFEFGPFEDRMDLCFVDGCHDFPYVWSDSCAAFRMVRQNGWVIWHDYYHPTSWNPVTRAIRRVDRRIGGGCIHVAGTTLAVVRVTAQAKSRLAGPPALQGITGRF